MSKHIQVCRTIKGLEHVLNTLKKQGKSIGFVPTMGALHAGHAFLFKQAVKSCDVVVCSIYANPTQFDNQEDLMNYPKTEKEDLDLFSKCGGSVAFIPHTDEVYYNLRVTEINYGILTSSLEGAHRKGHFDGMSTIVRRLFEIVQPDKAYFGEKDWQQLAIIKKMALSEEMNIEIIPCAIVREPDGLALSSRNIRLSLEERKSALSISKAVFNAELVSVQSDIKEIENNIYKTLKKEGLNPDYVKVVDAVSLEEVGSLEQNKAYRLLIAAYAGKTRLIDNGLVSVTKD